MQHAITTWILLAVSASMGAAGMGCDDACEGVFRCPAVTASGGAGGEGGGDIDSCPEDPADGPLTDHCAVWVAASWGDDGNEGTQAEPVATLARAITLAQERTGRVYACGEVYAEVVKLPSNVSLSGGFSCARGAWAHEGMEHRAIIAPGHFTLAPLTLVKGKAEPTHDSLVTDLRVEAVDALEPGASSIAVLSLAGARARIKRSHLIAGNGADGAKGEDGDHNGAPAPSGLSGNHGANACTLDPGLGGLSVKLQCGNGVTAGGNGGNGGEGIESDGGGGLQPPDPNPQGYGAGGKAEDAIQGTLCTGGIAGLQGNSGVHGAGALGPGKLTENGYVGEPGAHGFPGTPGQGGGGGGGSIGGAICGDGVPHGGAGGGSGGTGGCGGRAGKGGQAGGSSIALAVVHAELTLSEVRLSTGNGGNGGNGGALQPGGQGGLPGLGGLSGVGNGVKAGCHGGAGGQGGNGGNGGGGLGGHSASIAWAQGGPTVLVAGPFNRDYGKAGVGGKGGNSNIEGTDGWPGMVAASVDFPQ